MTKPRKQCCGNCRWWVEYASVLYGWCGRDGSDMLSSEGCSGWEEEFHNGDEDQDDHDEEEDDNDC
jgi:hypothetical protein